MLNTTTNNFDGKEIKEYLGVVTGEAISGANFVKDLLASLRDFTGGRSGAYEQELSKARNIAFDEMFSMDVGKHKKDLILSQSLTISKDAPLGKHFVDGTFIYQACDALKCIPHWDDFTIEFEIVEGNAKSQFIGAIDTEYPSLTEELNDEEHSVLDSASSLLSFFLHSFLISNFPPESFQIDFNV